MSRMVLSVVLSAVLAAAAAAEADPAESPTVVTVNGEAITLRVLEDELLRKEGVEKAEEMVHDFLTLVDWDAISDSDELVSIAGQRLTRLQLAAYLLRENGSDVRRELINITLVRQALDRSGLLLNQKLLDSEWDRQEREFQEQMASKGEAQVTFADFLRVKEEKSREEWMNEDGFRMAAALHELVHRQTKVDPDTLKEYFEANKARFTKTAAARLRVIYRPWPVVRLGDRQVLDAGRQEDSRNAMRALGRDIHSGRLSFDKAWEAWGKPHDQHTTGGKIGWVDYTGVPERPGARPLPKEAMDIAAAVDLSNGPVLLPPIEHAGGIDLILVQERREASQPVFDNLQDEIHRAVIEEQMEALTQRFMNQLIATAKVDYQSLTRLIDERTKKARSAPAAEPAEAAQPSESSGTP
ncbi:MAG: peptidylprolyl isomerase [Planctomycetota bacterium]|jgi:hypothetical protein|nr:peptidylprolyl isomerase [Planctomycetota bacterium]